MGGGQVRKRRRSQSLRQENIEGGTSAAAADGVFGKRKLGN